MQAGSLFGSDDFAGAIFGRPGERSLDSDYRDDGCDGRRGVG